MLILEGLIVAIVLAVLFAVIFIKVRGEEKVVPKLNSRTPFKVESRDENSITLSTTIEFRNEGKQSAMIVDAICKPQLPFEQYDGMNVRGKAETEGKPREDDYFEALVLEHQQSVNLIAKVTLTARKNLSLEDKQWGKFAIGDLFQVEGTKTTRPEELAESGTTPRVTCSSMNNGLEGFYKNKPTERGNVITIDSAVMGYAAYHEYDFIATDHVEKMTLRDSSMSKYSGLFHVVSLNCATKKKYNYGYKFSQERIRRQIIQLPVEKSGQPDYKFMEDYVKYLEHEILKEFIALKSR